MAFLCCALFRAHAIPLMLSMKLFALMHMLERMELCVWLPLTHHSKCKVSVGGDMSTDVK